MENTIESPKEKCDGVVFTLAMTHSRGRSCHGAEGVEEGEEWADVRVHRGRRPYGPWGTNKARVTKGASALQSSPPQTSEFCFSSPLSCAEPLTFSQASSGMCLLHTNTHGCLNTRWLVIIVMADAKNVLQLSKLTCNVNTCGIWRCTDICRLSSAAQHSHFFNVLDNGYHNSNSTAISPETPAGMKGIHDVRFPSVDFFIKV